MAIAPTTLGTKGIFFLSVVTLAFFAAPYLNLFFLLLGFLGVLAALSVPWTIRNLNGVSGEILAIGPAAAGDPIPVVVRIRSQRRVFGLHLRIALGRRRKDVVRTAHATLVPRGDNVVRGTLPPMARGVHPLCALALESSYPLGLVRRRIQLAYEDGVVVYPTPAPLPDLRDRGALHDALGGNPGAGSDRTEPSDLRPWREGDEIRSVYWPATARVGAPIVLERDGGAGDGFEVILDRRATEAVLEDALTVLTALALRGAEDKSSLELRTQEGGGRFGEGHSDWSELLRFLADATHLPNDAAAPPSAGREALRLPAAQRVSTSTEEAP